MLIRRTLGAKALLLWQRLGKSTVIVGRTSAKNREPSIVAPGLQTWEDSCLRVNSLCDALLTTVVRALGTPLVLSSGAGLSPSKLRLTG